MRIPRSRGAVSGVLLIVLGAWGAIIPLVGPYFDFVIGSDDPWNLTAERFWLSILPGIVAVVGGAVLLASANRAAAGLGAWLGLAAGAWFVMGREFSRLWNDGATYGGEPLGGTGRQVLEQLSYFDGLGGLIVAFSALALGRLAVRSVRDVELAEEAEREAHGEGHADDDHDTGHRRRTRESGRFDREPGPGTTTAGSSTTTADSTQPAQTTTAAERVREVAGDDRRRQRRGGLLGRFRRG